MNTNSISAVIPAYNAELFICETIRSLLKQSVKCNEIIIVDDGSTDSTREQVKSFLTNNVRLISLRKNYGVSYARNKGVLEAENKWVLFIDSDDIVEPHLIESLLNKLVDLERDELNQWVLIHSAYQQINEKGVLLDGIQRFKQVGVQEILGYEFIRNHVSLSGTLVNKKCFIHVGGFNEDLTHAEDWDLWLRLAQIGGFGYIDDSLVKVRRHTFNTSKNVQDMLAAERKVLSQYSLDFIREAIERRKLPSEENQLDYVNLLFRMDLWEKGYQFLINIQTTNHGTLNKKHFLKGIYFYKQTRYKEALHCFDLALKYYYHDGASMNNLAVCNALLGNVSICYSLLEDTLRLFPNYLDALYNIQKVKNSQCPDKLKLTWRQLRPILTKYHRS